MECKVIWMFQFASVQLLESVGWVWHTGTQDTILVDDVNLFVARIRMFLPWTKKNLVCMFARTDIRLSLSRTLSHCALGATWRPQPFPLAWMASSTMAIREAVARVPKKTTTKWAGNGHDAHPPEPQFVESTLCARSAMQREATSWRQELCGMDTE